MRPILLIGPYPPPFGGPGVHMMHLRKRLRECGAACEVLNIGPNRRTTVPGAISVRSALDFVTVIAQRARRGYHVHHFFNLEGYKAVLLAVTAALMARIFGGTYSIGFIGGPRQKYLTQITSAWTDVCRFPIRTAEFVICNNAEVKDALLAVFNKRTPIHPIECFYDGQVAEIRELPEPAREFVGRHQPVLCAVAHPRLETTQPHHELHTLISAIDSVRAVYPAIGCVVIGGSNAVEHYRGLVRASQLEPAFYFTGEVPHDQCLSIMKHSDVFVRAYTKDGSSSSVREALALAVPTVACTNPQHPEAVIPFTPNDGNSLACVLLGVLPRLPELQRSLHECQPMNVQSMDGELSLLLNEPTVPRSSEGQANTHVE